MRKVHQPSQEGKTSKTTKFVKGIKVPFYPNNDQIEFLAKTFGCCRYVWNKALYETQQEYQHYITHKDTDTINPPKAPNITGYGLVNRLIAYKRDPNSIWLNEVSSVALQQTAIHLGSAYSAMLQQRRGFPNYKKRENKQSFTLMKNSFRIIDGKVYIANCKEPLDVDFIRDLPSDPTSATITKTASGKYFISFTCEYYPERTYGTDIIGIDLGIKDFIVTSDGEKIPNPKYLQQYAAQLKRRQQDLCRKQKGSKNREKARIRVAQIYEKIVNCRNDHHHKLSRRLVNENQVISLEKLQVRNMVQNPNLAKSISDVSWSAFTTMLEYKARESQHCSIVYMDTWYASTHICNACQTKLDRKLKLSERSWVCPTCNTSHDRDINAAINIRDQAVITMAIMNIPKNERISVMASNNH